MRSCLLSLLVLFSIGACSQVSPKKRVAVFDFDNAAVQGGISSPFFATNTPDVGKAAANLLITKLVQDGNVTVIERNALDKVIAEQNLTNSDRTDPLTAAKLGKLLGVDAIILGTITHYDYVDKTTGGGGSHFGGFGGASMKTKHDITSKVAITARLVSPDTGEVWAAPDGIGEVVRKGVKMDLRDNNAADMLRGNTSNPLIAECMDKAIAQLSAKLEQEFPNLPKRSPIIEGLVADAGDSGTLVLNVGQQHGLKVGDRVQVLRTGKEIRDPETGKLLMRNDTLLGEAVVVSVNDISSVAHYEGTEPVKVRDLVRSLPPKP